MSNMFLSYKPPKKIRSLFIAHYAPLLLIIMIGPITAMKGIWTIPINFFISVIIGIIVFLFGTILYFKWESFWYKTYNGQLVTGGIFNYIRHPHYTSIIIITFGLAFFFYSIVAIIIAVISIPIMIWSIFDEEKLLIKLYGEEYIKFMRKTKWRMIPKIF